jgi:hypothetical protein
MKKILIKVLQLQSQMRILHWQTTSLGEHLAFGKFYDSVDPTIDKLIEAIQGKHGRISLGGIDSFQIADYSNLKIHVFLLDVENFFAAEIYTCGIDRTMDSEIENIVQEIRGELDKLKYLLTLK